MRIPYAPSDTHCSLSCARTTSRSHYRHIYVYSWAQNRGREKRNVLRRLNPGVRPGLTEGTSEKSNPGPSKAHVHGCSSRGSIFSCKVEIQMSRMDDRRQARG